MVSFILSLFVANFVYANPACLINFKIQHPSQTKSPLLAIQDLSWRSLPAKFNSDRSKKALIQNSSLMILDTHSQKIQTTLDLSKYLSNEGQLNQSPTEIVWSPSSEQLIILPSQNRGQRAFVFFLVDLINETIVHQSFEIPRQGVVSAQPSGLYYSPGKIIWLPQSRSFALKAKVKVGRIMKSEKESLFFFDSLGRPILQAGFDLDPGYSPIAVYWNAQKPQIIDVLFKHKQYIETLVERWDLQQGIKVSQSYNYEDFKPEGEFEPILFSTSDIKIKASHENFETSHLVPSPNGQYYLSLVPKMHEDEPLKAWSIDIMKAVQGNLETDKQPIKYVSLEKIPVEVNFENLEFSWIDGGESVIIKASESKMYFWHNSKRHFEVFVADEYQIIGNSIQFKLHQDSGSLHYEFDLATLTRSSAWQQEPLR